MAYSLWRGGEHLGDIVFPLPTSGHHQRIAGVFAPSPAFHDLAPGMQVHPPFLPGQPVFETAFTDTPTPGPIALAALSEDEAKGIPAHRVFVLRDTEGAPLPMLMIALHRLPTPPSGNPNLLAHASATPHVPYSGWLLHAAPAPTTDAREV